MSIITEAWRCNKCRTWHDDEDDARECCQPTISEGWKCTECGEYHKDEHAANDCCRATYTCPACTSEFETAEEAEECHGIPLTRATPAELEKAGQMRLPI